MTNAIVGYNPRHLAPAMLAALSNIARRHGYDENWLHDQLAQGRRDVMEVVQQMGVSARNEFKRFMETSSTSNLRQGQTQRQTNERHEKFAQNRESLTNSPASGNMDTHEQHNMGGAPEEGGEQQLAPVRHVWRKFPNTETACLKYVTTAYLTQDGSASFGSNSVFDNPNQTSATNLITQNGSTLSTPAFNEITTNTINYQGYDYTTPLLLQFRMTSPYNIWKTYGAVDLNSGTLYSNGQPAWLELFDQKYQYYHVMETEWEITFNFGVPATSGAAEAKQPRNFGYYIFWRYTNEDEPPTQWTGSTSSIAHTITSTETTLTSTAMANSPGTVPLTPDDYFRMGGWHHKHVTLNEVAATRCVLHGKYKYGQCKMDIKTMDASTDAHGVARTTAEGWGRTGATPIFPEHLSIIIVQDNAMVASTGFKTPVGMRFESEHLIQFKDLTAGYKFPTPAYAKQNASGATLNTDLAFFSRGAGYS